MAIDDQNDAQAIVEGTIVTAQVLEMKAVMTEVPMTENRGCPGDDAQNAAAITDEPGKAASWKPGHLEAHAGAADDEQADGLAQDLRRCRRCRPGR